MFCFGGGDLFSRIATRWVLTEAKQRAKRLGGIRSDKTGLNADLVLSEAEKSLKELLF